MKAQNACMMYAYLTQLDYDCCKVSADLLAASCIVMAVQNTSNSDCSDRVCRLFKVDGQDLGEAVLTLRRAMVAYKSSKYNCLDRKFGPSKDNVISLM